MDKEVLVLSKRRKQIELLFFWNKVQSAGFLFVFCFFSFWLICMQGLYSGETTTFYLVQPYLKFISEAEIKWCVFCVLFAIANNCLGKKKKMSRCVVFLF